MRVGMDLSIVRHGVTSGTAVYAYHLAEGMLRLDDAPELVLYCGARCSPAGHEALARLERLGARLVFGPAPWRWSPDAAWWLPVRAPTGSLLRDVDVFHVGEFYFPPPGAVPYVATIHDVTPQLSPEHHMRLNRRLHEHRLRWVERHANRIIVVSESTRRDLLRVSRISPEVVDLVYEARGHAGAGGSNDIVSDPAVVLARYGLDRLPYVLMVGTLEPRKNHVRVIQAFGMLADRFPDLRLVLVGGWGWKCGPIRQAIESARVRDRIHVLGAVPAGDLTALYAGARVFAFPSLYEGFGIPLLEAMAAGVPILTSNISSMPEVAGDAALLVDPTSVEAIATGLERLHVDDVLRRRLARLGRERERGFTWARAAQETIATYRRALGVRESAAESPPLRPVEDGRPAPAGEAGS